MVLRPTGTCFDDSLDFLNDKLFQGLMYFNLIHGVCRLKTGEYYSHAWVEDTIEESFLEIKLCDTEKVIVEYDKYDFVKETGATVWTTYAPWQALYHNWRYSNYGPWEKNYLALTRDKGALAKKDFSGQDKIQQILRKMGYEN